MLNPIKQIYDFNLKAGLLEKGYDDFLESSFQIEEALEGFDLKYLAESFGFSESKENLTPKLASRYIVKEAIRNCHEDCCKQSLSDVDRLDKACDAVVFAVGSMAKLGLNPNQITRALNVVMNSNLAKLSMPKDECGKLTKPDDFIGPESKLQEILDERS